MISKKPNHTLLMHTQEIWKMKIAAVAILILASISATFAEQCGIQAEEALCPNSLCCSQYGYCGSTDAYCGNGCQSQCGGGGGGGGGDSGVAALLSSSMFDQMLLHRDDRACPYHNFITYDAFIAAAGSFPAFGTTGDNTTRLREIAAFLAQTSHETTGGWSGAPDGPYAWGYCYLVEQGHHGRYCVRSVQWPCAPGKSYYGRGPIQLSYNYNYGQAGEALGYDLLDDPDLVMSNATISFESALWYWMTPQSSKPSCHDVIVGEWTPSAADMAAGRFPGYGVITNIINGDEECGRRYNRKVADRIGFYKRYCDMLGISYGHNLDCYTQAPFGWLPGNIYGISSKVDEAK